MNLDEFFEAAEADQQAHQERLKDLALHLLSTSTMRDDDEGLTDEIIRAIDLPNWSQTEFTKSYKKHGINN
jgi:hypothetical protein